MRSESVLHNQCAKWLRERGWLVQKLTTYGAYGMSGWPDVLAIHPGGGVIFFEWKLPGRKPTERQSAVHDRLREHKQTVVVVHTLEELRHFVNTHSYIVGEGE